MSRASTAKIAIIAKTKISLKAIVTLFPKKHGKKTSLHHPLFKYNCTIYVNIMELEIYKH